MKYFRRSPSSLVWLLLLSATAFLASGAALAATQYVVIQPIVVCQTAGFVNSQLSPPSCASFNSTVNPNPAMATSTTPIGFVDPTLNVNVTRAIWLQAGIDVTFLPIKEYNNSNFQNIAVTCTDPTCTSLKSDAFKTLSTVPGPSAAAGCTSFCTVPLGSVTFPGSNAINMFFLNTLVPVVPLSGTLYGFAWLNGNGIAVANLTFLSSRFDTLAHELGHNLKLDHTTNGAGVDPCPGIVMPSPGGCNVMDAGSIRNRPASTGCTAASTTSASPTGGALYDLDTGLCNAVVSPPPNPIADQLILGNSATTTQQAQALLSGFMNPIPNVNATAGGGDLSFTVTYPKFNKAFGRAGEFIFALVFALKEGFEFGTPPFTFISGVQPSSVERLNGNNGQGNSNCIKPISGEPSIQCLELDYPVINPNGPLPYMGTFTANTSSSFLLNIINKSTGLPATLADLACKTAAPEQCLDLTYVFSDLLATTTFFGAPVNGVSTGNSQLPDATVPSTIVDPADFLSVRNLVPPLTITGFSSTPCTSTSTSCPPLQGGNPGPD